MSLYYSLYRCNVLDNDVIRLSKRNCDINFEKTIVNKSSNQHFILNSGNMYSLHRVSECAFLFLIHLCYFILMLQLVLSENYIDKQSFKLVCGMQRNRFTKYINVRSRVICTGICARLDQCVGIKFDNGNNCIIYKDFQDCDKTYISSCLHLKRDTMLDLSKPWVCINHFNQMSIEGIE